MKSERHVRSSAHVVCACIHMYAPMHMSAYVYECVCLLAGMCACLSACLSADLWVCMAVTVGEEEEEGQEN